MDKAKTRRCIVTFARSWNSVVATRCLGRRGVEVISCDASRLASAHFSKFASDFFTYPDPDDHPEEYIDALVEECRKRGGPDIELVLMPIHTDSFVVAANRHRFEGIAKLALPSIDAINALGNKASLAGICAGNGINIPETVLVESQERFDSVAFDFDYPAFLKLPDSNASIGLEKVNCPEDAITTLEHWVSEYNLRDGCFPILQKAVPGDDFCCTFLYNKGEKVCSMTYHNLVDYPRKGGMGALRETVPAERMEAVGDKLLALMDWHGVAEIDFRWDGEGEPYLIEVNPRFWGGLGQCVEAGLEYPYLLYQVAAYGVAEPVDSAKFKNVKTFNPCLMVLRALEELSDVKETIPRINAAFSAFKNDVHKHQLVKLARLTEEISAAVSQKDILAAVLNLVQGRKGAIDELFKWRDPLPMLGLLYPLSMFFKHGKISSEMLISKVRR